MASQFHQLRVLVWKNWLGVKRQPVSKKIRGVWWWWGVRGSWARAVLRAILQCDLNEREKENSFQANFRAGNKIFRNHPCICLLANGTSLNLPLKQPFDFSKLKQ